MIRLLIYFIGIIILASVVVYFPKDFFNRSNNENTDAGTNTAKKKEIISNPELEAQYEKSAREIIKSFETGEKPAIARAKLLELRVPDKYKNLHLDLVIIFDAIIRGAQFSDQAEIEETIERLGDIKEKNIWMK